MYEILNSFECNKTKYNEVKEEIKQWSKFQDLLSEWPTDHYKREPKEISDLLGAVYYFFSHNLSYALCF